MFLTKLSEVMKARQLTVEDLAAKTMISSRTVMTAKQGKYISDNTGKRIAKVLKLRTDELM